MAKPAIIRFLEKIYINGNCWIWSGAATKGYGMFRDKKKKKYVHRFSYEFFKGVIPDGLVIDHICRTPLCVNPAHLEAVTQRTNLHRGETIAAVNFKKTHCIRGHLLGGDNLRFQANGRQCKKCKSIYDKEYYKVQTRYKK